MARFMHPVNILVDPLSYLDAHGLSLIASAQASDYSLANTITEALVAAVGGVTYKHVDVLDVVGDGHWLLLLLGVGRDAVVVLVHLRGSLVEVARLSVWRLRRFGKRHFVVGRMEGVIVLLAHEGHG